MVKTKRRHGSTPGAGNTAHKPLAAFSTVLPEPARGAAAGWTVPSTPAPVLADPASVERAFHAYAPRVYNLLRRLLSNPADLDDVSQEVFLQVLRNLPEFRGEASFPTWLYRVAVNAALTYRRKRAVREQHRVPDPLEDFLEDGSHRVPVKRWMADPEEQALDREAHEVIEAAIARLPDIYRDVYVLSEVEELPNAEVAEMLGLSVAAVKSRLHRARLVMRTALSPYFEERQQ